MGSKLLEVKNLKTQFFLASGIAKAVDGVSFSLEKGKTLGIVGESGSGKSVTASSILRLLNKNCRVVDGEILFEGKDLLRIGKKELQDIRGKDIAMIFQDPMTALDPVFKIGNQMVEQICAHEHVSREKARKKSVEMLRLVGIPEPEKRLDSYPYELSGGMCQRVLIAMAVSSDAKLIIADEPTTALDVTVQSQVLRLLKDLQNRLGTSILMITHNLGIVWKMCDEVLVMYAGQIVERASMSELYRSPLHPYTWGLLDSIPRLSDENRSELKTIPGTPPDLRLTGSCCNFCNRCPYAQPECSEQIPDLKEIDPGHWVSCLRQEGKERLKRKGGEAE